MCECEGENVRREKYALHSSHSFDYFFSIFL